MLVKLKYEMGEFTETGHQWPETISSGELDNFAQKWHSPMSKSSGVCLSNSIMSFGEYQLRRVPISELNLDLFRSDDYLIHQYASQPAEDAPPIIVDLSDGRFGCGWVIDGNHRAKAARARGDQDILAYVADFLTYDPSQGQINT